MSAVPKYQELTANGNVRTADLLKSIAKLMRRKSYDGAEIERVAAQVERLALEIEAGK